MPSSDDWVEQFAQAYREANKKPKAAVELIALGRGRYRVEVDGYDGTLGNTRARTSSG